MRKLRVFALLFLTLFIFSGCNLADPENPIIPEVSMDAPAGVSITNGVVSWNAVTDAVEYRVVVGTLSFTTVETSYDLKTITSLAAGDYQVSIIAVGSNKVSLPSQTLTYSILMSSGLNQPVNLAVNEGILSWSAVDEATYYVVFIDKVKYQQTSTTMNLNLISIPKGSHQISITALNDTKSSVPSSALSFTLSENQFSSNYQLMLSEINENYEPSLTLEDFDDNYQYYNEYLMNDYRIKNMLLGAFTSGINEVQLMEIMDYIEDVEPDDESTLVIMEMIKDMKDFDLTATQWSEFLFHLALNESYLGTFNLQSNITQHQSEIIRQENDVDEFKSTSDYVYWNSMLQEYLTAEEYQTIQSYLNGTLESYPYGSDMNNIFYYNVVDRFDRFGSENPWTEADEQEVHRLLFKMLVGMDEDDLEIVRNEYETGYKSLYVFDNIRNTNMEILDLNSSVLDYEKEYQDLLLDYQAYLNRKTIHVDAIKTVMDYIWLLEETIPNTWLASVTSELNDETFTLEELAILKDEIIDLLILTIPTEEDFVSINKALYQIILTQTNELSTDETLVVSEMAGMQHQMIEMLLTFIGWIDIDQMTMIQERVPELVTGLENMESMEDLLDNLDTMTELIGIWNSFITENKELSTSIDDETMTILIEFVFEIVLRYELAYLDPQDPNELVQIQGINYLIENKDLMSNTVLKTKDVLGRLYLYMFGDEGAHYEEIIQLIEAISLSETPDYVSLNALKTHLLDLMTSLEIDAEFFKGYAEFYLVAINYSYTGLDQTNFEATGEYVGEFINELYLVTLDMIEYLSVEDIVEIMTAQSRVTITEEFTETRTSYEYICDDQGCDIREVIVEYTRTRTTIDKEGYKAYMLLVAQTLSGFIETYPTHVDSIEALLLDETAADLYALIMSNQLEYRRNYDEIKAMIDRDKLGHMLLVANMFRASIDMLDEFASSDGEILDYFLFVMGNLSDEEEEEFDPQAFVESILPYLGIALDYVNEETAEPIFKMYTFVTLMDSFQREDPEEFVKYAEMFDSWVENGSLILLDVAALVDSFNTYLIEHADYSMFETYPSVNDQMAVFMIKNMHAFLTSAEIDEIKAIANQVVEHILSLPQTMEVLGFEQADIDEIQTNLIDSIDFYNELFSDLSGRFVSEQFEDFYYIDYVLRNFFNPDMFESFNPYMIDGVELEENVVIDYMKGDHVIIPFEPLEDGYYGVVEPVQMGNALSIYRADQTEVTIDDTDLTPVNLEANQLYYFIYYNYTIEGQFTLSIEQVDMTGYFEDDPIIISEEGKYPLNAQSEFNYIYYKFEATETSRFVLSFEEDYIGGYPNVYITETKAEGESSFWGDFWLSDTYFMYLNAIPGSTYIIRIETEESTYQSFISWNEEFSNSELDPIALDLDVALNLSDYQPFNNIWLSFDLETENRYALQFQGSGYASFNIYDNDLNLYDSYWYYDSSEEIPVIINLPKKGFIEIQMDHYYQLSQIALEKSEEYIETSELTTGVEQNFDITGDYNFFNRYFKYVALSAGKYMIVLSTDGWGEVSATHEVVYDIYYDFSDSYNELKSFTLEEGDELILLISVDSLTYVDVMIDIIENKGTTIETAVVMVNNVQSVYYLEGDYLGAYYTFTPTVSGQYELLMAEVQGYVYLYQTNSSGGDSNFLNLTHHEEGDYDSVIITCQANVTYYFYIDSQYPEARYLFGVTDSVGHATN